MIGYLQGLSSLSEATAAATLASRRYAKRQRTWLRSRMGDWRVLTLPLGG
jgi:tRNA dimethylallyltransferase